MFERSFFRQAPETPRLVVSLRRLAREVDRLWPDRRGESDGWLGDTSHAARPSDHNPDGKGRVHALDVTAVGIVPTALVRAAVHHPSTEYVIWNRQIYSRWAEFTPRPYAGPNPHTNHVHISVSRSKVGRSSRQTWLSRA